MTSERKVDMSNEDQGYTKGQWDFISGQVVRASDAAVIANMDRSEAASLAGIYPVERDNNARLIAAAPDMYETLVMLRLDLENNGEVLVTDENRINLLDDAIAKANARA